jgi:GDP/UDP-N,N'-diacetylbacillosamine 2-epimerase (hydrolysing)
MTRRRVCVVTGTRADYGLLYPVLKKIKKSPEIDLQLVATSAHLSSEFGLTFKQIESDGFFIDAKLNNLNNSDTKSSIVKSSGKVIILLSDCFEKLNPSIVLILGDRFETHAAATAALLLNIPIAHIHGGEISEGAVDEQLRHSITKMSYLHFCSNEAYRLRIIQMGENPNRVFNTGAPGIDNIKNISLISKSKLEIEIGWKFDGKTALFTYHPETLSKNSSLKDLNNILKILQHTSLKILFTSSNADSEGKSLNKIIQSFCKTDSSRFKFIKNLGQLRYLSAMNHSDLLIGNSSSGIIEAASFFKPVVNIGDRQKGRLRGLNVVDSNIKDLKKSIDLALSIEFLKKCKKVKNIYGSGDAAPKIVNTLVNHKLSVKKSFFDIKL